MKGMTSNGKTENALLWALPVAAALAGVIWWLLGKVLPS